MEGGASLKMNNKDNPLNFRSEKANIQVHCLVRTIILEFGGLAVLFINKDDCHYIFIIFQIYRSLLVNILIILSDSSIFYVSKILRLNNYKK